ncbi:helix-turn-helix domain-containing protein [Psychrobacter frigidicola]|uniref:helix-turn-helix domain-containing protein n=1 Tax=Psychrobacter frigidicola TaxID=45611 RepID=UPI0019186CB2|nr:helix-turn-helix domain-containing protein [Psychrobacter frigidicola]
MDKLKTNQKQIIKTHLLTGASISSMQAYEVYKIVCLTSRISELKKQGLQIEQKRINGNGTHWNVYWLDSDYIDAYNAKGGKDE